MRPADEAEFCDFVSMRRDWLRRTAYLICGDWSAADDVVQDALIRMYGAWRRIRRRDDPSGYARRVVVNAAIERSRRPWRREISSDQPFDTAVADAAYDALDDRMLVMRLLAALPPRQRAHLVMRYLEQLTIAETADVLHCSPGTVKSETSKALAKLRDHLAGAGLKELRELT